MPDHVHALTWFPEPGNLSDFMQVWKQRSSVQIKRVLETQLQRYARTIPAKEPVWQAKYYPYNVYSEHKVPEKLAYMHENPVRTGLVERIVDWPWSSARWYGLRWSVEVPIWLGGGVGVICGGSLSEEDAWRALLSLRDPDAWTASRPPSGHAGSSSVPRCV